MKKTITLTRKPKKTIIFTKKPSPIRRKINIRKLA